ncbi:A/G-specific adenine glycosylase [Fulvivirga sp. RKSG066]|uniref:A/G-specific adenine glycosylase n=1 Tax=Fulvivirga aurantia TaxID=2529383 RepID=UPI0012BD2A86|nr:A/G-specific adenine glycosylase [Fulvivirga aurantia]MTI22133.1 A/G-specific adenine glycosylase [Fulvivirga aurantia]
MPNNSITSKLLNWYKANSRDLPWRETTDPYKIWLSEIILQQTRVAQGLPYYESFVNHYPKVELLAQASEQEVLRLWQGLGYYSRARNLHACAKLIVEKYEGKFPKTYSEILKLPGVGQYTAAAIASFAYREVVPVIDGNVFRVLSRLFGIDKDILSAKSRKDFEVVANDLISQERPDLFNQAIMEFGALQCTPKSPNCIECPLALECYARAHNLQGSLPVKIKKVKVKKRYFFYMVFEYEDTFWMSERTKGDIWQGLFDFHLTVKEKDTIPILETEAFPKELSSEIGNEVSWNQTSFKHILTHQVIYAKFSSVKISSKAIKDKLIATIGGAFYTIDEIKNLPKPVLVSKYLNEAIF